MFSSLTNESDKKFQIIIFKFQTFDCNKISPSPEHNSIHIRIFWYDKAFNKGNPHNF
jgi:hypothetical protein